MAPLTSLDLFSGVCGITRALEGFAHPIAYCEINEKCQEVIRSRMKDGSIPKAALFSDVRKLNKTTLLSVGKQEGGRLTGSKRINDVKPMVNIIVGGWPCQDLSAMGHRKGLSGERSGLIREVFRLTDELKPSALFLENVPLVLKEETFDVIVKEFVRKRGYNMRWAVIPAGGLGAPHHRKRWFCLLTKSGFKCTWNAKEIGRYRTFGATWTKENAVRMVVPRDLTHKKELMERASMMGNSVVPDCVRAAFMILVSGFTLPPPSREFFVNVSQSALEFREARDGFVKEWTYLKGMSLPSWGSAHLQEKSNKKGIVIREWRTPHMSTPDLKLVLDASLYSARATGPVSRDILPGPTPARAWSTPRHSSHTSNVITLRTMRDLPTQVRFEKKTPDDLRKGVLNPQFVEWMMGYPKDYTCV